MLAAYAPVAPRVPAERWSSLIEARRLSGSHFKSWAEADAFIANTAGAVMELALHASATAPEIAALGPILADAALVWGHVVFARSSIFAARAPGSLEEGLARAEEAYGRIRSRNVRPSLGVFPAIGYLALAPNYIRALRRGERETPLISRQLRLIFGAAMGGF